MAAAIVAAAGLQPVAGQENDTDQRTGTATSIEPRIKITVSRAADIGQTGGKLTEVQSVRPQEKALDSPPASRLPGFLPTAIPLAASWISSRYGRRLNPVTGVWAMHRGVDLAAPYGTPVFATSDGTVAKAGWLGGYGIMVVLRHGAGIETRYGHLSAVSVRPGTQVRQGQLVGYVGSTGRSTGPHLHYEIRRGGNAIDPEQVWAR